MTQSTYLPLPNFQNALDLDFAAADESEVIISLNLNPAGITAPFDGPEIFGLLAEDSMGGRPFDIGVAPLDAWYGPLSGVDGLSI